MSHTGRSPRTTPRAVARRLATLLALFGACTLGAAWAQGGAGDGLPLHDFADGAPAGRDAAGNPVGFVTWQDGSSTLELSVVEVGSGDVLALPDQRASVSVLRVRHDIASWGGFTHAFADAAAERWLPLDLAGYRGIRFWYRGDGRGGPVQFDLFDNRDPDLPGDSAARWALRFDDDASGWRRIEIPFERLSRRTDFQPGGAPDDGLTLSQTWGWALGFPPGDGVA